MLFRFVCIFGGMKRHTSECVCVTCPGPGSYSRRRLGSVETADSLGLARLARQCCDREQGRWSGKQTAVFVNVVVALQNS